MKNSELKFVHFERNSNKVSNVFNPFNYNEAIIAYKFHQSIPEYSLTPLADLSSLSSELNISKFYVKDESFRFSLNSFKGLGSSFAIGKYISKLTDLDILKNPEPVEHPVRCN